MAFKRTLVHRLFRSRLSSPSLPRNPVKSLRVPPDPARAPDPGDQAGFLKRILPQRRPLYQSAMPPQSGNLRQPETLLARLKEMDIARDRIRLDALCPPAPADSATADGLTVSDVRKLLRLSQLEVVKARLKEIERDWMNYSEFVKICGENCGDEKLGLGFAKMLDDCGEVIVLGNLVCLRPEQEIKPLVYKAIQGLISLPVTNPNDPRLKELEEMEKEKAQIDQKAESLVRRELWCGLGYLVAQTAAFMRLTFWELSWDVMEPICFYVTSFYFMAGYTFFLRTSKEPSFEGFFQSRFSAKQKRLMKIHGFNLDRFNKLRRACYPYDSAAGTERVKFSDHSL